MIAVANAFEHGNETAQSLQFGTRAMRVRTQAVVNERADFRVINAELVRGAQHARCPRASASVT